MFEEHVLLVCFATCVNSKFITLFHKYIILGLLCSILSTHLNLMSMARYCIVTFINMFVIFDYIYTNLHKLSLYTQIYFFVKTLNLHIVTFIKPDTEKHGLQTTKNTVKHLNCLRLVLPLFKYETPHMLHRKISYVSFHG